MNKIINGVSVIIPFYNSNEFLDDALMSVQAQNIPNIEVIVCVDHQSEQPEIVSRHNLDILVVQNTELERGAGVCRYIGSKAARYRFLAFLDADDFWLEGRLKKHLDFMLEHNYAFSFAGFREIEDEHVLSDYIPSGDVSLHRFLQKSFTIGCLTVIIDRKKVPNIRKNTLKRRNDYRMWYDVLIELNECSYEWGYFPNVVAVRRLHGKNLTRSKLKSVYGTWIFYGTLNLAFRKRVVYFYFNVLNTIFRKIS